MEPNKQSLLRVLSKQEYAEWTNFMDNNLEDIMSRWQDCENCNMSDDCDSCIHTLIGLDESDEWDFLYRVRSFVESVVEELYVHKNWSQAEKDEYGFEIAYLVELYIKYFVEEAF